MFTADAIVPLATLLLGIVIGVAGYAAVQWVREETAFTEQFRAALKAKFAEYRTEDGGRPGVLLPLPEELNSPKWVRSESAGSVAVLDRQQPTWPTTDRGPGAHRAPDWLLEDDTRQILSEAGARVLREAGR